MSFATLLINTATIQRFTEAAADSYGTPVKTWATHPTYPSGVDCRLVVSDGREVKVGAEIVVANNLVFFEDIDVTEQDRVIIDTVTYEVILVLFRQDATGAHHKQCLLRVVR